ncbi:MAG: right-handed parallel beta-helix repeat-containing protein, partial [Methanosarcinales archaeon]|nr:right-handed parallel beta-helix repeat-containing protein [Methanosarcinales archaeon]
MNECNQTDGYNAVLRTKMCVHVRMLVIMALAAAAVLVVSAGVGAAATTWYVDDGGGDGVDFTKIQDAVDAASARDTIYVYDGVYNEHVAISTSITLFGQSESGVTINGGGSGNCVQVSSADVAINGFTITNASGYGIYASSSDVDIENVTITGNGHYGIYFYYGKGFTLRNSTIDGNRGGITYDGYATGDAVVEDNTITDNVGYGMAISLVEGKSATVRNNKIDNNAGASSDGIYVYIQGTGGVSTIESNIIENSGRYGIYLTGATNSTISRNNILKNSYGMRLYSSSNVTVFHNNFIENANYN